MSKFFLFIGLFCLSYCSPVMAQLQASKWYFNNKLGLDFSSGSPQQINESEMQALEGCAVISDADGNVLLYSNGQQIWNKNHQIMSGGANILGHYSATQSVLIVPKPGSNTIYYVFTTDRPSVSNANVYPNQNYNPDLTNPLPGVLNQLLQDDGYNNGVNYVTVDITADNGNGAVVSGSTHLITYDVNDNLEPRYKNSERLTGIADKATGDIWVISHFKDRFNAFKVTTAGVNPVPVVSPTIVTNSPTAFTSSVGSIKVSPDREYIAMTSYLGGNDIGTYMGYVALFHFDPTTGGIVNEEILMENVPAYSVEFSPNGSKLYASIQYVRGEETYYEVYQFDLEAVDIRASATIVNQGRGTCGALQLAIDGKIYHLNPRYSALACIHNPNEQHEQLNYQWKEVDFSKEELVYHFATGLPNYLQSYFDGLIAVRNTCLGEETIFTLEDLTDVLQVDWNLGDGTVVTGNTVQHTYMQSGSYLIGATVTDMMGNVRNFKTEVFIAEQVQIFSVDKVYGCDTTGDGLIDFIDEKGIIEQAIGNQQNVEAQFYDEAGNYLPTLEQLEAGTYTLRVFNTNNKTCVKSIQLDIEVGSVAQQIEMDDVYACTTDKTGYATFSMQRILEQVEGKIDTEKFQLKLVRSNGDEIAYPFPETIQNLTRNYEKISLVVTEDVSSCSVTYQFYLVVIAPPQLDEIENNIQCAENITGKQKFPTKQIAESIPVKTEEKLSFYTTTGEDITEEMYAGYTIRQAFSETIIARLENKNDKNCFTERKFKLALKICKDKAALFFPKFFTPNQDGYNDKWQALPKIRPHISAIKIFDRYGKLLAKIPPNSSGWDGIYNGKLMPKSSYWFSTRLYGKYEIKGHFALLY